MKTRWKVACVNWSTPTAPHAIAYLIGPEGFAIAVRCFDTHAEAITYADNQARRKQ